MKAINKIAVIAGKGFLPTAIIDILVEQKREFLVITLDGEAFPDLKNVNSYNIPITKVGAIIHILKKNNVKEILFAGKVIRPNFYKIFPDLIGWKLLLKIIISAKFNDSNLFKIIFSFLEKYGFKIIGIKNITNKLMMVNGSITNREPNNNDLSDINLGREIAYSTGQFDIGQALVIKNHLVLGIEAVEGTNELIKRIGNYKNSDNAILVKIKKPNQDERIDLPVIGIDTVKHIINAKMKGVAVEAKYTIILDIDEIIELCNKHNLFIYGF